MSAVACLVVINGSGGGGVINLCRCLLSSVEFLCLAWRNDAVLHVLLLSMVVVAGAAVLSIDKRTHGVKTKLSTLSGMSPCYLAIAHAH